MVCTAMAKRTRNGTEGQVNRMRLIDADELMMRLRCNVLIDVTPELEKEIEQQPTAFDKEKVIKELKTKAEDSRKYWSEFDDEDAFGEMNAYKNAIEIVEKGGIE